MTSLISWLDASTEEISEMGELVKLLGTPETTHDLGMGRLWDVISTSLFPGTSVLHFGARYMLLVPWAYQTAHGCTRGPEHLRRRDEESERQLIGRFKELGVESFVGRTAGQNVHLVSEPAQGSAQNRTAAAGPSVSRDVPRTKHMLAGLAKYRRTLGQARQDDLLGLIKDGTEIKPLNLRP